MRSEDTAVTQFGALLAAFAESPRILDAVTRRLDELGAKVDAIAHRLPPALASVSEAARRLGLSIPTVRRRIKAGELPTVKIGARVLVDLSAIKPVVEEDIAVLAEQARRSTR